MASPDVVRFTCLTFAKMTAQSRKLGDFTPVDLSGKNKKFNSGNFSITFYDPEGAQRLVKNDTQITTMYPEAATDPIVKDAVVMFAYKKGEGWYIADDYTEETYSYPMNDYVINDGDGFQVFADGSSFTAGVKLTCSGEVPNAKTPIIAQPDIVAFTGNSTLAPVTLGSLTPVDLSGKAKKFNSGNFYITFFDENGAQRLVKNDTQITTMYPDAATDPIVMDAVVMFAYKKGEGWYIADDYTEETYSYPMNEYVINPGEGFQIFAEGSTFAAGVQLDLPNALAPAAEEE